MDAVVNGSALSIEVMTDFCWYAIRKRSDNAEQQFNVTGFFQTLMHFHKNTTSPPKSSCLVRKMDLQKNSL
jgi:hypothetical protein